VLPKSVAVEIVTLPSESLGNRHVKVFGGQEIILDGPINLEVTICGLRITHPFLYVDAEIPAIGGYDLLKAAHIMIDTQSAEVWSKHPDVVRQASFADNIFVTVPASSGDLPCTVETVPAPCVTADTRSPSSAPGVLEHRVNPRSTSCAQEETVSTVTDRPSHRLNPLAQAFDPTEMEIQETETKMTSDDLPDHINLLYETTIAQTHLTSDVDQQFRDVLRRRATSFATDSTEIGFCPVLQHDVDTVDSPPIKQSPRRPPLSAGTPKMRSLMICLLPELLNLLFLSGLRPCVW